MKFQQKSAIAFITCLLYISGFLAGRAGNEIKCTEQQGCYGFTVLAVIAGFGCVVTLTLWFVSTFFED